MTYTRSTSSQNPASRGISPPSTTFSVSSLCLRCLQTFPSSPSHCGTTSRHYFSPKVKIISNFALDKSLSRRTSLQAACTRGSQGTASSHCWLCYPQWPSPWSQIPSSSSSVSRVATQVLEYSMCSPRFSYITAARQPCPPSVSVFATSTPPPSSPTFGYFS